MPSVGHYKQIIQSGIGWLLFTKKNVLNKTDQFIIKIIIQKWDAYSNISMWINSLQPI